VPNPCHGGTSFAFTGVGATRFRLSIYDIQGRKVREMAGTSKAGETVVNWDCRDDMSRPVSPGVYLYRIAGDPMSPPMSGKVIVR
jgi:flagellar hook assembly protein FlgD